MRGRAARAILGAMQSTSRPFALVVVASRHGHCRQVAERLATALGAHGVRTTVREARGASSPRLDAVDAVVVVGAVHMGRHPRAVVRWARRHAAELRPATSALVSVSLIAAEDSDEARAATRRMIEELARRTGWHPDRAYALAGALQYREYGPLLRAWMRRIVARAGHPEPDTSRDHVYTDWAVVDAIGAELAQLALARRARPAAAA
jgi:menaquinone-dependent protoporphyrinogen IX oxidase